MQPTLNELKSWCIQAGDILRSGYEKKHQIFHKGEIDLVTEIDKQSEKFILNLIQDKYPDHAIISEECSPINGNGHTTWYIDPLDGTVNYAHGIPYFSVSIAFADQGKILLGAVYDPLRNECFTAARGQGAWMNDHPIHVSQEENLIESLLVTGFPYDIQTSSQNNLDNYSFFSVRSQAVRRLGSAALDMCYVASGRFDGYWELSIKAWDIAASSLIVQEAGGIVSGPDGNPYFFTPPYAIVAANPILHAQMVTLLQQSINLKGA